jgi:hypothetical protein
MGGVFALRRDAMRRRDAILSSRYGGDGPVPHGEALDNPVLSELVTSFITAHLRGIDDLHLLVAMASAPERWFDVDTVARELAMTKANARAALEHLAGRNLLEIRVTGDIRYQFNPGTPMLRDAANACVEVYRRDPMPLWRLGSDKLGRRRSLWDFADAFRIRRHDDR